MRNTEPTNKELMDFMREHLVTRAEFAVLVSKVSGQGRKMDRLYNSFDKFSKETLQERQENKIRSYRLDRLETWVETAAKKINIPYKA